MSDINVVFGVIGLACGIYVFYACFQLKVKGLINTSILLPKSIDPDKCRDKVGYIKEVFPKMLLFGTVITAYGVIELVNPQIIETSGKQEGSEGCLSYPNQFGIVCRPMYVKVKAYDRHGNPFFVEGKELLARAFCHEIDHLHGIVFLDLVSRMIEE